MTLCVGGELDGQEIEKDVKIFKASEIDPSYTSTYYLQIYNRDNVFYEFWHPHGVDLHELSNKVLEILHTSENYLRIYEKEVPFSRNRINRTNLELTNVLLGEARKELDQLWGKYEIALYSLEVLNIKYKKNVSQMFL